MALIIDKRLLPKNTTAGSRQKFIDRYKGAIKKRVKEIVGHNSIKDYAQGSKKVRIRADDLNEPSFEFNHETGNKDRIYIGNKSFKKGDKLEKPSKQKGNKGAGNGGEGQDDFEFVLTEKEFADLFFEDLALPDLLKKEFLGSCWEIKHAGYSRSGGPSSLNIKKTMLNALGRRAAIKRRRELEEEEGKKKIQYIEDLDLRYNFREKVDMPSTKAVMFCLMDVSGSMGEKAKDIAKRFYILLNMFLKRNYSIVDVVFVRHTEVAEEVTEEVFFHGRESGGTIVSSGYEKVNEIINKSYNPEQWNVYVAQASDGDNWEEDNDHMKDILTNKLLGLTQYFAYIDIKAERYRNERSGLFSILENLMNHHKNLQAREVDDYVDIFPVFRSLFKKKDS